MVDTVRRSCLLRGWLRADSSPARASNNLRRVLEAWDPGPLPANVREMRVFRSLVAHGFPRPSRQHVIRDSRGRFVARVDLAFVPERIGLEVHSRRWHATPRGLARDERREARIRAAGWDVRWCEPDDIPYSSIGNALRAARAA